MLTTKVIKVKKAMLLVLFLIIPLGYFARINIGTIFVGLYYWDILLVLYIALSLLLYFKHKALYRLYLPTYYKVILVFILFAALTTLNSYRYLDSLSDFVVSSMYLIRWTVYVFAGIMIFFDLKSGFINANYIKNLIIGEGMLISIAGFLQLIFLPDFTMLDKSLMWDPHQNRLAGLYFDPNFAGIILVLTLSVLLSEILNLIDTKLRSKTESNIFLLYLICFITIFTAIVLTFSRSTWLALAILILIVGLIKFKWIIPIAFLGMFLVYYAVPRVQTRISGVTDPTDSFYFRYISWSETYEVAKTNPIIGYGFNTYRYIRQDMGLIKYDKGEGDRSDSGSDSSWLFVWVTTGLIGFSLFLFAHIKLFLESLKNSHADNLALFFAGFQIAILINSQFINSMFFPALSINLAVFIAIFLDRQNKNYNSL